MLRNRMEAKSGPARAKSKAIALRSMEKPKTLFLRNEEEKSLKISQPQKQK